MLDFQRSTLTETMIMKLSVGHSRMAEGVGFDPRFYIASLND